MVIFAVFWGLAAFAVLLPVYIVREFVTLIRRITPNVPIRGKYPRRRGR